MDLTKLEKTVQLATTAMEECDFMNATESARNFTWHVFCDHYLEATKYRLYGEGEPKFAAQQTLYYTMKRMLQLLAPVMPHITEEIYNTTYASDPKNSIHRSKWPTYNGNLVNEEAENAGDIIVAVIAEIRAQKNRLGIPLNKSVNKLTIYSSDKRSLDRIRLGDTDIRETLKIMEMEYGDGQGQVNVTGYEGLSITLTIE